MSKHEFGHRHQSGSLQELAERMIAHLGGLPTDQELAEPDPADAAVPTVDWVNYDTLMEQQRGGKVVR